MAACLPSEDQGNEDPRCATGLLPRLPTQGASHQCIPATAHVLPPMVVPFCMWALVCARVVCACGLCVCDLCVGCAWSAFVWSVVGLCVVCAGSAFVWPVVGLRVVCAWSVCVCGLWLICAWSVREWSACV